ncbi:MAG: arginine--tRNA ligase, partial [Candidatus Pacearchaeota archaeon]|nr:arginine--tRNA ligase [Candidatus Pacearchaeota archaeon]
MIADEFKEEIEEALVLLQKQGKLSAGDLPEVEVEVPEIPEHGDYSTNIALRLSKLTEQSPQETAHLIAGALKHPVQVAQPGFLNMSVSLDRLAVEMAEILKQKERYGKGSESKKIVVEYSSPNIAKRFGIGHLRSTIIGQAIYNLFSFQGNRTIGDNHLGDWGTQFGALIYQIERVLEGKSDSERKHFLLNLSVEEMERLYTEFHLQAENNEKLRDDARAAFKRLEDGDTSTREIWEASRRISLKEFDEIYSLLGVRIDHALGEAFFEKDLTGIIEEVQKKGIAKESQGALIVEFEDMPPAMLRKSDGASTYFTRDLATARYRLKKWEPDFVVIETGAEQSLHFRQVFRTVELLGWAKEEGFFHVGHGLYRTKEGKFSTRRGKTVQLKEVLEDAIERAEEIIEGSATGGLDEYEKKEVARMVGIGGVKYNDLVQHPRKDIVFEWDRILNLRGNSAAYIQYTHARCQSILGKARTPRSSSYKDISPAETSLLRILQGFPLQARLASQRFSPNLMCSYAFSLAQAYNHFYQQHRVLEAESKEAKDFRLCLTAATAQILKTSLSLLG